MLGMNLSLLLVCLLTMIWCVVNPQAHAAFVSLRHQVWGGLCHAQYRKRPAVARRSTLLKPILQ